MKIIAVILFAPLFLLLSVSSYSAASPAIVGPDMEIIDNNIIVGLAVADTAELESTIQSGIAKEIIYTIELLRVSRFWPDEFIVSKRIEKIIKYDNLRDQYRASSYDGIERVRKQFKDYGPVNDWIFRVSNVNLANIRELEPGRYYVRTIIESRSIEHIPLIGTLMNFIPEVEMTLAGETKPFTVGGAR